MSADPCIVLILHTIPLLFLIFPVHLSASVYRLLRDDVLQGNPVFFTYTTSSSQNATIVAHCQKLVPDPEASDMKLEKAVWVLQKQDTGERNCSGQHGRQDKGWVLLCNMRR